MVRIYDESMKEVFMPKDEDLHYGSYPLELILSSIQIEKSGRKTIPVGRTASLRVFIIASRHTDMDLKISNVFEFFRSLGVFYVAKENEPFKLLKVEVNSEYTPEIGNTALTEFEIPLTVLKPFYRQSLHTTADIDREGVRWNDKWGYGMGLSAEKEQWKYSFKPEPTATQLNGNLFENGSIFLSNGQNADTNQQLGRLKDNYPVVKNDSYRLNLNETGGTINYIRIFHYDSAGNKIGDEGTENVNGNGSTTYEFTALGDYIRLLLYASSAAQVNVSGIGTVTEISLSGYVNTNHTFKFYNASTEEIKLIQQKESSILLRALSNASWVEIDDGETTFRLDRTLIVGGPLTLKGHQIRVNNANVLHQTNRNYLTIKKGWNEWEIRGIKNFEFDIDFRFLYD